MTVQLGDLVAGYHMGKYFLGYVSRLDRFGIVPTTNTVYPHAVTWFNHWNKAEYTTYGIGELEAIEHLKLQFEQWKAKDFK